MQIAIPHRAGGDVPRSWARGYFALRSAPLLQRQKRVKTSNRPTGTPAPTGYRDVHHGKYGEYGVCISGTVKSAVGGAFGVIFPFVCAVTHKP